MKENMPPLTRPFRDTVQAWVKKDKTFRRSLLCEAVNCMLAGELNVAKTLLRDYVNGTIGFERLSSVTGRPSKSLMRMLGPTGNPNARNLLDLLHHLQEETGVRVEVR